MTEREGDQAVGWAERLERLARLVPGVGAYQDREGMREADKQVRVYLAGQLHSLLRELEPAQRRLADAGRLERLPSLDRIARRLSTLADRIRYASYGFAGVFAAQKIREPELAALHGFDLRLVESLPELSSRLRAAAEAADRDDGFPEALEAAAEAVRRFDRILDDRDALAKGL
jgi:hypothetical protein